MKNLCLTIAVGMFAAIVRAAAASETGAAAPVAPRLLSQTGLYADAATQKIDSRNRLFSPQYPLWSDGATKRRWVQLPVGSQINVADLGKWELPVGTRFWKEFSFKGRKVETRFLWHTGKDRWVFASYAWNDAQTDAALASETGVANIAEIADGQRHSIPSVSEEAPEESRGIDPGHPESSTIIRRVRSRRPVSQMPPIGTVIADREAVDLLTSWIQNSNEWKQLWPRCAAQGT